MKKDIHPTYFEKATVKCACGNTYNIGSTKEFMEVEVCPKCHPFFTGEEKILETVGQIQKFKSRIAKKQDGLKSKKVKKAEKKVAKKSKKTDK